MVEGFLFGFLYFLGGLCSDRFSILGTAFRSGLVQSTQCTFFDTTILFAVNIS